MAYAKIKKNFEEEAKQFAEQLITDELQELSRKIDRTTEEEQRFFELETKTNAEYQEFLVQKGLEKVQDIDDFLSVEEYDEIVDVNSGNDVIINGITIKAPDYLEIVYGLFVKESIC